MIGGAASTSWSPTQTQVSLAPAAFKSAAALGLAQRPNRRRNLIETENLKLAAGADFGVRVAAAFAIEWLEQLSAGANGQEEDAASSQFGSSSPASHGNSVVRSCTTRDAGDPDSNLALGKQWSRDYPTDVPATPTLPKANLRYQELSTGADRRRMQLPSESFVRAVLIELSCAADIRWCCEQIAGLGLNLKSQAQWLSLPRHSDRIKFESRGNCSWNSPFIL